MLQGWCGNDSTKIGGCGCGNDSTKIGDVGVVMIVLRLVGVAQWVW